MNAESTRLLHFTELIAVFQLFVSSLEIVKIRYMLKDHGLLRSGVALLRYPAILILVAVEMIVSFSFPFFILTSHSTFIPLAILTICVCIFNFRSPQGNDGADQMMLVILLSSTLAEGMGTNFSKICCLFFVAAQASLSYGVAGFLKVFKAGWFNGSFVLAILRTSSYGNKKLLHFLVPHRKLAKVLGWVVVCGDCMLSFAIFFPPKICLCLLSYGLLFHLGMALVSGLNTFLWAFGASYPAIYFVSMKLHEPKFWFFLHWLSPVH
jgi:hypothetical protein